MTNKPPAMRIEVIYWAIDKLLPYARTLRKHDHAVERMMGSIREFGFKIPVLIRSTGEVIDGHLRLKAALRLGLTEVPVILCDEFTAAQVKAFRLAANRSAAWADWDQGLVALELCEIKDLNFDLDLTGFDGPEIDRLLLSVRQEPDPDQIADRPVIPVTKQDDLWICGAHRVLCADSTRADTVRKVLGGQKPFLMITDPPYGVEYDPEWREQAGLGAQRQTGTVRNDHRADWQTAYEQFEGDVAYVWHAGIHAGEVARGLVASGFQIRGQIIWAKQHFALSRGHYHWQHEPCWYVVRNGRNAHWQGDRNQSTLWQVDNLNPFGGNREEVATGHGTQKPVELMRRPILNHTESGAMIYDPFLGSGSVLVAAEQTGRMCAGIDIDPGYVDTAVRRWQELTGREAVLEGSGRNFEQVRAERLLESGDSRTCLEPADRGAL